VGIRVGNIINWSGLAVHRLEREPNIFSNIAGVTGRDGSADRPGRQN